MINIAKHDGYHMWSRNCLYYRSTRIIGLVFCVVFCRSFCSICFFHCIVFPSSIYYFSLPFDIFKLFVSKQSLSFIIYPVPFLIAINSLNDLRSCIETSNIGRYEYKKFLTNYLGCRIKSTYPGVIVNNSTLSYSI